jgi:hypothetical protein|tara:strand:+ start:561 stop:788 length:228 start_codon:yes stop_codon:yes gene_type:complete
MSRHENEIKFLTAVQNLKPDTGYVIRNKSPETEEEFNSNIEWVTGKTETDSAILSKTNPHSELTWTKVKEEMDKL